MPDDTLATEPPSLPRSADMALPGLIDRAARLLHDRGGSIDADELATWVFGTRGGTGWVRLLDPLLEADPRFARSGQRWCLATRGDQTDNARLDNLVAVAIATTGSDPTRHRVVRLSAARCAGHTGSRLFDAVVNPGRRVPRFLCDAAALTADELNDAPTFADVAEPLLTFFGDAGVVSYGVHWIADFLSAELVRAGWSPLANHLLELDQLGQAALSSDCKPGLRQLAAHLGVNHPRPKHPPTDAAVTAAVTTKLLHPSDPAHRPSPVAFDQRTVGAAATPRPLSNRRWLDEVPNAPGVYTIEGGHGAILYVGKAVDLQRRIRSYFGRPLGLQRHLEGLAARAERVTWRTAPSDLEARLLEARLIREQRPPFNVARTARARPLVIRAAPNDPIPRLELVRAVDTDGALYLGPFRSVRAARDGLALVRTLYPSSRLRRAVDPPAQRDAVLAAVRLLTGHKAESLALLRSRMTADAARGDHLAVAHLRAVIRAVQEFTIRPSALLGISDEPILAIEPRRNQPEARAHLLRCGRLLASTRAPDEYDRTVRTLDAVAAELEAAGDDQYGEAGDDETAIVLQWLAEVGDRLDIIPLSRLRGTPSRRRL